MSDFDARPALTGVMLAAAECVTTALRAHRFRCEPDVHSASLATWDWEHDEACVHLELRTRGNDCALHWKSNDALPSGSSLVTADFTMPPDVVDAIKELLQ